MHVNDQVIWPDSPVPGRILIRDKESIGTLPIDASLVPSNLSTKIGQALTPLKHPVPDLSYAMKTESI